MCNIYQFACHTNIVVPWIDICLLLLRLAFGDLGVLTINTQQIILMRQWTVFKFSTLFWHVLLSCMHHSFLLWFIAFLFHNEWQNASLILLWKIFFIMGNLSIPSNGQNLICSFFNINQNQFKAKLLFHQYATYFPGLLLLKSKF